MSTSPPISEALSLRPGKGQRRALAILDAKRRAVAVAKIKLRQVAVQMLLAGVLIDALHAALEDRIEAFDRVAVDRATAPLVRAMVNVVMAGELLTMVPR